MAQLADRVRHVERLKDETARTQKYHKREKVAYIGSEESNQEFDIAFGDVETKEVDTAELKPGPPYTCKSLRPSDGNNPVEPSNERYVPKTYTFGVTKCDEIYDILVADGQVVAPKDLKIPPLEQHKKKGFCKYHNYLGHNISRCSLFKDLVQKGLNEGRLKFGDKPKPQTQVDSDPLKVSSTMYTDISGCNMVEAIIDEVDNLSVEAEVETRVDVAECQMVDITKDAEYIEETTPKLQFDEKAKKLFSEDFRDLISIAEKDVLTTTSRCPGTLGTYQWVGIAFGVKNDGATYLKVKEVITSEKKAWNKITVCLAERKSRKPYRLGGGKR